MKVLVLLASIGVFAQARPEAAYSYPAPSNSYGAPGAGLVGASAASIGGLGLSGGSFGGVGAGAFGTGSAGGAFGGGISSATGGGFVSGATGGSFVSSGAGGYDVSSGGGYGGTSLIQKHIYVHVPPPEPVEHVTQQLPQFRPAQKHFKIVFIKAPTPPTPTAANIQLPGQDEQKTLIYVLVKKPDEAEALNIQQPAPTQPSKPEVYFIKYKTQKQVTSGGTVGGGYPEAAGGPATISNIKQTIGGGTGPSSNYGPPGASGPY